MPPIFRREKWQRFVPPIMEKKLYFLLFLGGGGLLGGAAYGFFQPKTSFFLPVIRAPLGPDRIKSFQAHPRRSDAVNLAIYQHIENSPQPSKNFPLQPVEALLPPSENPLSMSLLPASPPTPSSPPQEPLKQKVSVNDLIDRYQVLNRGG